MAKMDLKSMAVGDLMKLRARVELTLSRKVAVERQPLGRPLHKPKIAAGKSAGRARGRFVCGGRAASIGVDLKPKWLADAVQGAKGAIAILDPRD